jgi:hypothetical protein
MGPAPFCGTPVPPAPLPELLLVTDGAACHPDSGVGRVPNNAAETVASLDGRFVHLTYADPSNPANTELVTVVDGRCEPPLRINLQSPDGISSHDAPSVFADGEGYVYVAYNGFSSTLSALLRKSGEPDLPRTFGAEQPSRVFTRAEVHGFTGRDGAIYLIGHNLHTRLDIIEPNWRGGAISYRYPGALHVVTQDTGDIEIPGCVSGTRVGNRFTKGYITEGLTSDGQSILLAVWGWAGPAGGTPVEVDGLIYGCADIRDYAEDSHEVFFAYSLDGGGTWWNREGTASRTAPVCMDSVACSDPSAGIMMNDPAFMLTTTRQREKRAAWYDTETDTVYLAFAKSRWCDAGVCRSRSVTDPGALMFLRFPLGPGPIAERKVADGDYTHIPAIRQDPQGRLYLYAVGDGLYWEHVSDDDGETWHARVLVTLVPGDMGRAHGHAWLPCAPDTLLTAGATSGGPLYLYRRNFAPEPGANAAAGVTFVTLLVLVLAHAQRRATARRSPGAQKSA